MKSATTQTYSATWLMKLPAAPLVRRPRRIRWVIVTLVLVASGALGAEVYRVVFGANINTVVEGKIYRSAQLNCKNLRSAVEKYDIRTVLNLRGCCPETEWYPPEAQTLRELGVHQVDIALSSYTLPPVDKLRRIVETLEQCEYPLLIH